jgi:hypothetical protein
VNNEVSELGPLVMIQEDTLLIMAKTKIVVKILGKSVSINGKVVTSLNE